MKSNNTNIKGMNICIENYTNIRHRVAECDFDTNEYPNTFVSRKRYEQYIPIYSHQKNQSEGMFE